MFEDLPSSATLIQEVRATTSLAAPLALTLLSGMAISATDVLMSGWLGPRYLAAETLASTLGFPMFFFSVGLAAAVSPMVAQELARGDQTGARRTLRQGLWALLGFSLPIMLILWFSGSLLKLFGQDPKISEMSQEYLRYGLWGTAGSMGYLVFRNFLAAHEKPRVALYVMLVAIATNALLNYILMFGKLGFPRLELVGLGISTSLTNLFTGVALAVYLAHSKFFRDQELFVRFWRPDWPRLKEIFHLGFPIAATMLAEAMLFAMMALMIGLFGPLQLAAYGIAIQYAGISYMFFAGVAQASTVRVAHFAGTENLSGVRRAGLAGGILGMILIIPWAAAFIMLGAEMASLFLDAANPETPVVIAIAAQFLLVGAAFQFGDAAQVIALGALRGLKDTRIPFVLTLTGHWVLGLPFALLFGFVFEFKGPGIWIGIAIGLTAVALSGIWRFFALLREMSRRPPRVAMAETTKY